LWDIDHKLAHAGKHIVEKVGGEITRHQEQLDEKIRTEQSVPQTTRVLAASMDGANVLLRQKGVQRGRPTERPVKQDDHQRNTSYKNAMVGAFSFYGDQLF